MVSAGRCKSPVVFQMDSLAGAVWRRLGCVFVSFINLKVAVEYFGPRNSKGEIQSD